MSEIAEVGKGKPEDFEHFVYEKAMTALYGKKVWDWYNDAIDV